MSSRPAPTQLRRRTALARLEAEELADAVSELRSASHSKSEAEGLLERVARRKPAEITQRSVIDVERVLGAVRESYPARRWSEALAAFLHDRDLLGQSWAHEGIEQLRRGELVER